METAELPTPSISESAIERQQVNVVYYEGQNALRRKILEIDEKGQLFWNHNTYDMFHVLGSIFHVAIEWTTHIFFICLVVIVGDFTYLFAPLFGIAIAFICYAGYYFDRIQVFLLVMLAELMLGLFYLSFGIALIIEAANKDILYNSHIIQNAYVRSSMALGIYLILCFPVQLLFIFTVNRGYRYGYSLFYWAPTPGDEKLIFRGLVITTILLVIVTGSVLIAIKATEGD